MSFFFDSAILIFFLYIIRIFFLLHLKENKQPFHMRPHFFCTMYGFFRILEKRPFEVICTRLQCNRKNSINHLNIELEYESIRLYIHTQYFYLLLLFQYNNFEEIGGLNLHSTAYFIAITVVISQLSMVMIWYRNILQYHNNHNSLPFLEKSYSLLFPVIFIRCEIGRLNFLISRMDKKVKELMKHVSIDSANATISQKLRKLSLRLKITENRRLDAKNILTKMQNIRLVLGEFPQCIVNISLLFLAMTNARIKKYMVQISNVLSENLKSQAALILNQNFQFIVICLIIKTMLGLIMILIKNRYYSGVWNSPPFADFSTKIDISRVWLTTMNNNPNTLPTFDIYQFSMG